MDREEILDVICDIYEEQHISEFGFDLKTLCNNMEINIVPNCAFENNDKFIEYDEDGFSLLISLKSIIMIKFFPKKELNLQYLMN